MRRLAATVGLVLMAPIAFLVVKGELAMTDAAIRAGAVLAAVIVVTFLGRLGLELVARSVESQPAPAQPAPAQPAPAHPARRAADVVEDQPSR